MFLLIPISLILLSFLGIAVIMWRKVPYLKKLAPESHEVGESIWHDLFPEVIDEARQIHFKEYFVLWLRELEKFLRKVRLLFSKIDRISDGLIKRVRVAHRDQAVEEPSAGGPFTGIPEAVQQEPLVAHVRPRVRRTLTPDELKAREQQLIVEIAKDPKNIDFYIDLGDIYVKMENFKDARESFETALRLNPAHVGAKRKLAALLKKMETLEGSESSGA